MMQFNLPYHLVWKASLILQMTNLMVNKTASFGIPRGDKTVNEIDAFNAS